jgi:predicted lactoylglutathione lyase
MPKMIFVNLPVADLDRSIAFYKAVGAEQNMQFSDETGACMVFSEAIHVMILTRDKYRQFTRKPIADAHASSEVLLCLNTETRGEVDSITQQAAAAGGVADPAPVQDHGWMYSRSFEDPDGHHWELAWMDLAALVARNPAEAENA